MRQETRICIRATPEKHRSVGLVPRRVCLCCRCRAHRHRFVDLQMHACQTPLPVCRRLCIREMDCMRGLLLPSRERGTSAILHSNCLPASILHID